MLNGATGPWKILLSILFFPVFFQTKMIAYCWAAGADVAMWVTN